MIITCTNILIHSRLSIEAKFILCVHEFFSQYYNKKREAIAKRKEIPNGRNRRKSMILKEFLQNQSS